MGKQEHGTTAALDDQQPVEVVTAVELAPASAAGVKAAAPAPHINHTEGEGGVGEARGRRRR